MSIAVGYRVYLLQTAYSWILICDNLYTLIRRCNLFTVNIISQVFLINIKMHHAFSLLIFSLLFIFFCWLTSLTFIFSLPTIQNIFTLYMLAICEIIVCTVPELNVIQSFILTYCYTKEQPQETHNCYNVF